MMHTKLTASLLSCSHFTDDTQEWYTNISFGRPMSPCFFYLLIVELLHVWKITEMIISDQTRVMEF
jgi:hypothetical protein